MHHHATSKWLVPPFEWPHGLELWLVVGLAAFLLILLVGLLHART